MESGTYFWICQGGQDFLEKLKLDLPVFLQSILSRTGITKVDPKRTLISTVDKYVKGFNEQSPIT